MSFVYPSACYACREMLESKSDALCAACWQKLRSAGGNVCSCCMNDLFPLQSQLGTVAIVSNPDKKLQRHDHNLLCYPCHRRRPQFATLRSLWIYDNTVSRALLLQFKYADRTSLANFFAALIWQRYSDFLCSHDLVIPVPLHSTRLWRRMYNQSSLLANSLSRLSGLSVHDSIIRRRKRTPSLGKLNQSARKRVLRGAFFIEKHAKYALKGKKVLLVDDVMTTGVTLDMCAGALLRAGAQSVSALVVARNARALDLS